MILPLTKRTGFVLSACLLAALAPGQMARVATWNTSLFTGANRLSDIQTVLFAIGPAGSMNPDILIAQEIQSPSAANAYLGALNASQPGTWAVTFGSLTGTSSTSDSCVFYKPGKVSLVGSPVKVAAAGGTSGQPRDTWRFDFHLKGAANPNEVIGIYDVHMKSGSTQDDIDRRQIEAQHIRDNADTLPAGYHIIVAGDFNMQASTQTPYQTLVGVGTNPRGRFRDPISTPGTWENSSAFRFVHTQDPIGAGGMDSRHDQILLGSELVDGLGTDYVGSFGIPYSTTDWEDPNHSYRAWGNDGTSFNGTLKVAGNTMVGATIAQAIINAATPPGNPGGHIPVFLDLSYDLSLPISGTVNLGSFVGTVNGVPVSVELTHAGSGTVVDNHFIALGPGGVLSFNTPVDPGSYDIYVKASHWLRKKVGGVNITLDGSNGSVWTLISGDVNGDNVVSLADFSAVRTAFGSVDGSPNWNPNADLNGDGVVSLADFSIVRTNFGMIGD